MGIAEVEQEPAEQKPCVVWVEGVGPGAHVAHCHLVARWSHSTQFVNATHSVHIVESEMPVCLPDVFGLPGVPG